jgi:hypothetical protein
MNRFISSLSQKLASAVLHMSPLAISSARSTHIMTFVVALTMSASAFAQQSDIPKIPAPTPTDCKFHPWHAGCPWNPGPTMLMPAELAASNQIADNVPTKSKVSTTGFTLTAYTPLIASTPAPPSQLPQVVPPHPGQNPRSMMYKDYGPLTCELVPCQIHMEWEVVKCWFNNNWNPF